MFGSSSHIAPSIPVVGIPLNMRPRPSTDVHIHGTNPRHVNIGGISYIASHYSSSSTSVPSNLFLMTHPNSHGPSGQSSIVSHVHSALAHIVVSQVQVPPYVSAGCVPSYG